MKLEKVLNGISPVDIQGDTGMDITAVTYTSRDVSAGSLFFALKGIKQDGFAFIGEAERRGAAAVVSERPKPAGFQKIWIQVTDARTALAHSAANFFEHPSRRLSVIGITGTKGKTTITYLLEAVLQQAGLHPGVIGTISYRGPGLSQTAKRTTPEAPDLQRMMKTMLKHGGTHCVMEISSHALDLDRAVATEFDVAVFNNLSGEHLDYHKSMEDYFAAKKKLFSLHKKTRAVVNSDDPWGKKLISDLAGDALTFGMESGALVRAESFTYSPEGLAAQIRYPEGGITVSSSLLGKPNLYNILAASAAALVLDIPHPAIEAGIASVTGVPGRFQRIANTRGLHIFVDYAHTDDALRNLLETARELCRKRILLVFGAGGDRDTSKRARMGEIAGVLADWSVITSDNPRSEDPMAIITEIERGLRKAGKPAYEIEPDRKAAIGMALERGQEGDYILVAGKGHEDYQIIGDRVYDFDDATVIAELLLEMGEKPDG